MSAKGSFLIREKLSRKKSEERENKHQSLAKQSNVATKFLGLLATEISGEKEPGVMLRL